MLRIPRTSPPQTFVEYRASKADYSTVSSDLATRYALWEQQGARCAYCERRLRDPSKPNHRTRIEHFHPQSGQLWVSDCAHCSGASGTDDATTCWSNLLLCCDGNEAAGANFTCDKSKVNQHICEQFRNPKTWHGEKLVVIDDLGIAQPAPGLPADANWVLDVVLNLNAAHLVRDRKEVIAARKRAMVVKKDLHNGLSEKRRHELGHRLRKASQTDEFATTLLSLADRVMRV